MSRNTLPSDFSPVFNPKKLLANSDEKLFKLYRSGAVLHVQRGRAASSWWLTPAESDPLANQHFLSDRRYPGLTFIVFGREVDRSVQRVKCSSDTALGGVLKPVRQSWVFDQEKYDQGFARWKLAVQCAETFNALAGTEPVDLKKLSPQQRIICQGLRYGARRPMTPQVAGDVETLCRMGLARVVPEGWALRTDLLLRTPVSTSSKRIQSVHAPK